MLSAQNERLFTFLSGDSNHQRRLYDLLLRESMALWYFFMHLITVGHICENLVSDMSPYSTSNRLPVGGETLSHCVQPTHTIFYIH